MADLPPFAGALTALLADVLDDPTAGLASLERLSGGASRETWAVDVACGDGSTRELILQRARPGAPGSGDGSAGMGAEADLLGAVGRAGVPVAPVLAGSSEPDALGAPFLLVERMDGETIPRRLLRDDRWAAARPRLVRQCAEALAGIHALPLEEAPSLPGGDQLELFRGIADSLGDPHPVFEVAFRWLADNRPATSRRTVVHGDFRLGNLLVGPEGLGAVLDWELTHVGDPVEDLGWLCVRAWRFGADAPVAGLGSREELRGAYEAASGVAVSEDELRWWEVMGTLKWGVMCIIQAVSHLAGLSRSVELAAIGRRVCETEHDLLVLLGVPPGRLAEAGAPAPRATPPHDRPGAAELVEAVREFLEGDVAEATTGRVRYHARVAVNVLGMVERELSLGAGQAEAHGRRLAALGVADDAELASAVRDGAIAADDAALLAVLAQSVADKLSVANPRYPGSAAGPHPPAPVP